MIPYVILSRSERKRQNQEFRDAYWKQREKQRAKDQAVRALFLQQEAEHIANEARGIRRDTHITYRQTGKLPPMKPPTDEARRYLWKKQNGRCQYCCASLLPYYHVDHIHPKSKGGKNHLSNYCLACARCNLSKSTQSAESFAISLLV